jgi:hypothetical protein
MTEHPCFQEGRIKSLETNKDILNEFKGEVKSDIKHLCEAVDTIKTNDLHHINQKLNLIFVMIAVAIIGAVIKIAMGG